MYQKCTRFRSTVVEVVEVRNRYAPDLNDRCYVRILRMMGSQYTCIFSRHSSKIICFIEAKTILANLIETQIFL